MILAEDLHKHFGEIHAVNGVSFSAPDGAVTGILGPNGAGKTTALRMIYGLVKPDQGRALVNGVDVRQEPLRARSMLGALPDAKGIYARLTARENIRYFGRLQGLSGANLETRIDALIDHLDMNKIADRRALGFSQGERMKVALARVLVHDPSNILLDEPTNGLDVMSTRAVRELIRSLRDLGKCVVFSSHIMQEVSALCDEVVIVSQGRIVAKGSPEQLRTQTGQEDLEEAFVNLVGLAPGADKP